MEIAPGTMVTPNVRLVRLLGEGGMGSVWVARHLSLETDVAVKFISSELSQDDPEILARFRREAKLAAPTSSAAAFRDLTPLVAPVASATVALGLGGFGLLRSKDELLGPARRPGYGAILLIASLLGIGIAYRLLRSTELLRGLLG